MSIIDTYTNADADADADSVGITTNDAVVEIERLYNAYGEKWNDFVDIIQKFENGAALVKEVAKFLNIDIPKPPDNTQHFYLKPKFKWGADERGVMCNTLGELLDKISNWDLEIFKLEAFIQVMKVKQQINLISN